MADPTVRSDIDLGPCGGSCAGRLHPVMTEQGRFWEAERCDVCNCSWWYQVPKFAWELPPAGVPHASP